ncbi:glutathione S-transferase family protein [Polynucleobacter necessarius]|uniref:glutathione S-transferase family protein n=1 Tax=Polynucleobacter necessarius TaxID=576610 RepID=UPI000E091DE3|nr:glutathione S-transferase N-terminal domain-containing protein [Polynucleobacter necessarius]
MLRLWGRKTSINVQKVLWCLAELGLQEGKDFERIDAGLHFGKNNTPDFLKMNPNGLVPLLEDGDLVLWESNTILRYLASQYDKNGRFPKGVEAQYGSEKMMDWQLATLWPPLRTAFLGLTRTPEKDRDYDAIYKGYQNTNQTLGLLDRILTSQDYCSGNQFNIGDIVVALGVHRWVLLNDAFAEKTGPRAVLKNVDRWLEQLRSDTCFSEFADKELNIVK